jgi:hypothetical protein
MRTQRDVLNKFYELSDKYQQYQNCYVTQEFVTNGELERIKTWKEINLLLWVLGLKEPDNIDSARKHIKDFSQTK